MTTFLISLHFTNHKKTMSVNRRTFFIVKLDLIPSFVVIMVSRFQMFDFVERMHDCSHIFPPESGYLLNHRSVLIPYQTAPQGDLDMPERPLQVHTDPRATNYVLYVNDAETWVRDA